MSMWTIPPALAAHAQFVRWIARPSTRRPGKTDKFPVDALGRVSDSQDPSNWLTAAAAQASTVGDGMGFVFTENDPLFFLDIDGALVDGQWSPVAVELCQALAGCFVEVSQSGTGLHIIGSYAQRPEHGTRCQPHGLELYTKGRYVALTGMQAMGDPAHVVNLSGLVARYFPPVAETVRAAEWSDGPRPEWSGPEDDDELIQRMLAAKPSVASALGDKLSLQQLWDGETQGDNSSADAALCSHLAFWTGCDCERMDRLFRRSGLCRPKWDDRPDYRQRTILHAIGYCERVYQQRDPAAEVRAAAAEGGSLTGLREGTQFLSVPMQTEHFAGCVYIRNQHRIRIPDGSLLKPEQFKATYGGYQFAMDVAAEKCTRNAWEAFTECNGYDFPKVHDGCFRPEILPGAIVEEEGVRLVNTYTPISTPATPGDPGPFLQHMRRLVPDDRDRTILLSYMAALVQFPGVKFQWCPLVQGMEGNGKTLLVHALSFAVGRRYTHLPNACDVSNKFNSWLVGKLFIAIEEIYTLDRLEAIETLKPLITNSRVEIQGKGDNQATGDNRANFLLTSNHQDAIRKTRLDRRYCVFYTAQQRPGDLERDGMGGEYFPRLYQWLNADGYAIVNHFLRTYPIAAEFNPADLCQRAPETTSTAAAVASSMGAIEQEVVEAIEESRPGFAGGWVSSLAFDKLLEDRRASARIPRARRRELMQSLGYDWHPGLREGRVNNHMVDVGGLAGKPRLYIRSGHLAANLASAPEIIRHYLDAQSGGTVAGIVMGGAQNF